MTTMERNYYKVVAAGSGARVTLGYELLERPTGTRKWKVVKRTHDPLEAKRWVDNV